MEHIDQSALAEGPQTRPFQSAIPTQPATMEDHAPGEQSSEQKATGSRARLAAPAADGQGTGERPAVRRSQVNAKVDQAGAGAARPSSAPCLELAAAENATQTPVDAEDVNAAVAKSGKRRSQKPTTTQKGKRPCGAPGHMKGSRPQKKKENPRKAKRRAAQREAKAQAAQQGAAVAAQKAAALSGPAEYGDGSNGDEFDSDQDESEDSSSARQSGSNSDASNGYGYSSASEDDGSTPPPSPPPKQPGVKRQSRNVGLAAEPAPKRRKAVASRSPAASGLAAGSRSRSCSPPGGADRQPRGVNGRHAGKGQTRSRSRSRSQSGSPRRAEGQQGSAAAAGAAGEPLARSHSRSRGRSRTPRKSLQHAFDQQRNVSSTDAPPRRRKRSRSSSASPAHQHRLEPREAEARSAGRGVPHSHSPSRSRSQTGSPRHASGRDPSVSLARKPAAAQRPSRSPSRGRSSDRKQPGAAAARGTDGSLPRSRGRSPARKDSEQSGKAAARTADGQSGRDGSRGRTRDVSMRRANGQQPHASTRRDAGPAGTRSGSRSRSCSRSHSRSGSPMRIEPEQRSAPTLHAADKPKAASRSGTAGNATTPVPQAASKGGSRRHGHSQPDAAATQGADRPRAGSSSHADGKECSATERRRVPAAGGLAMGKASPRRDKEQPSTPAGGRVNGGSKPHAGLSGTGGARAADAAPAGSEAGGSGHHAAQQHAAMGAAVATMQPPAGSHAGWQVQQHAQQPGAAGARGVAGSQGMPSPTPRRGDGHGQPIAHGTQVEGDASTLTAQGAAHGHFNPYDTPAEGPIDYAVRPMGGVGLQQPLGGGAVAPRNMGSPHAYGEHVGGGFVTPTGGMQQGRERPADAGHANPVGGGNAGRPAHNNQYNDGGHNHYGAYDGDYDGDGFQNGLGGHNNPTPTHFNPYADPHGAQSSPTAQYGAYGGHAGPVAPAGPGGQPHNAQWSPYIRPDPRCMTPAQMYAQRRPATSDPFQMPGWQDRLYQLTGWRVQTQAELRQVTDREALDVHITLNECLMMKGWYAHGYMYHSIRACLFHGLCDTWRRFRVYEALRRAGNSAKYEFNDNWRFWNDVVAWARAVGDYKQQLANEYSY